MDYYYSLDNQPAGPVPLERLHELYQTGVITLHTLVVPVGGTEWKPYSSLRPEPHDLAGSAVPGDIPASGSSGLPTTSMPSQTDATAGAGSLQVAPVAQPGYGNLVLISWVLLGLTALLSVIPIVGCITWVMLIPVFITTVILGVLTLQRGGTTSGILILITSVVVLPLFTIIAPILTTALFGVITGAADDTKTPHAPIVAEASPVPRTSRAPASATTNVPNEREAKQLIDATMTSFKNAVNSGSFDAFYRTELSDLWKKQITADKLRNAFEPFIDRKVDLSAIFDVDPVLDELPYVDGTGLLRLLGHYPVPEENVRVKFELSYSREARWALSGIKVNIEAIDEE